MTATERLHALARELDLELRESILPYWYQTMDRHQGGFAGWVGNDHTIDFACPKGVVMHARHLWASSAAWLERRNPLDLAAADHAYAFLTGPLRDAEAGGFWWTVDQGRPTLDTKVLYGQAFAIYALAQYARATGNREALDLAVATFDLVESVGRDRDHGGYYEAVDRNWSRPLVQALSDVDIPCAKSMNTNLHLLEAFSSLSLASGLPRVNQALADLLEVFERRIVVAPDHLGLYFDRDWTNLTDHVSYGHDIEASWLMTEAAHVLGGHDLVQAKKEIPLALARRCLELVRTHGGGLVNELHGGHLDTDRIWWVQAEALVGLVNAWELSGDDGFLEGAEAVWRWVKTYQIDRHHGEWFWQVDARGVPNLERPKGGLWKTSYHNGRACLEVVNRARRCS